MSDCQSDGGGGTYGGAQGQPTSQTEHNNQIVPPHKVGVGGEDATIEFAIVGPDIRDIIVCGHSHFGAVNALLATEGIRETMPAMCSWLSCAGSARRIVEEKYSNLTQQRLLNVAINENVLGQWRICDHIRPSRRPSHGKG